MNSNFENYISNYFNSLKKCTISEAMAYAMEGGKRVRPEIIFAITKGFGLAEEIAYDAALALEMIQTYSLIHDDLPAMDNDDMRRGKPSLHKAYREDLAILTGDELLTESFGVIADSKIYNAQTKVNLISCLSKYAGLYGMVYGQFLDVTTNSNKIDEGILFEIQDNKTGGLFKVACLMGMYICNINRVDLFTQIGSRIGQIFQNQDDLFDLIKSENETGKTSSDFKNDKGTALSLHSIDELKDIIEEEFNQLESLIKSIDFDSVPLLSLIDKIRNR